MKGSTKGFTLIELLIVIAIIALLASMILTSLGNARKQGADTRVVADVKQVRSLFEQDFTGHYIDIEPQAGGTDPQTSAVGELAAGSPDYTNLNELAQDAANQGGPINYRVDTDSNGNVSAYAVYGQLISNPSDYFCMDSTGNTNLKALTNNTTVCPS